MDILTYLIVALIISLIFISIISVHRDRNMDLQMRLSSLKAEYDERYKERINGLVNENIELKKYKTLYELEISNKRRK